MRRCHCNSEPNMANSLSSQFSLFLGLPCLAFAARLEEPLLLLSSSFGRGKQQEQRGSDKAEAGLAKGEEMKEANVSNSADEERRNPPPPPLFLSLLLSLAEMLREEEEMEGEVRDFPLLCSICKLRRNFVEHTFLGIIVDFFKIIFC